MFGVGLYGSLRAYESLRGGSFLKERTKELQVAKLRFAGDGLYLIREIPHDIVNDSVVKWAGLILSEVGAFKLGNASLKGSIGIRLCWECNSGKHRSQMKRLAKLDNFIFAKMGFLGSANFEVCACSMGSSVKMRLLGVYVIRGSHTLHGIP